MKFTDITLADVSVETKVETLGVVLDQKLSEIDTQVSTVSKLIGPQGPKGEKGDKGAQGPQGVGKDGKDGLNGKDGKDGKDGTDGKEGVSVVNASVALDGSLVLELSDGSEVDAGDVVGPAGPGGMNGAQGPMGLQGPQGDAGPAGADGIDGTNGTNGTNGVGVPVGGTTGQVLSKINATDYSTQWTTPNAGTVTSVGGTGTVSGLTLTGTVTSTGSLTLGGTLSATASNISDFSTAADARISAASIHALSDVTITSPATSQVLTYNGTGWINQAPAGGGGSPGGVTTEIQYNNAGAFAGTTNVTINNNDLTLALNNSPVTPPANTVKLVGRNVATRVVPGFVGPSGVDSSLQPLLGRNKVAYISFTAGAATSVGAGIALTATGTATSATFATTNLASSINRIDYRATTAATTAVAGFRGTGQSYWIGTAGSALGGFTYICRWSIGGLGTNLSTMRAFVGLRASTGAPTDVAPNTLTNAIGMGWDSGDTTVQIYSAGTANSKINTGITLNRVLTGTATAKVFEIAMFARPGTNTVNFQVTELNTANTFSTTVSTSANLPITTNSGSALNPYGYTSAGGTSTTMSIAIASLYIETDY